MNATFSQIRQEEIRIKVMIGTIPTLVTKSSALMAKTKAAEIMAPQNTGLVARRNMSSFQNKKFCRYCQRIGHLIEEVLDVLVLILYLLSSRISLGLSRGDSNSTWRSSRGNVANVVQSSITNASQGDVPN